MPAFFFRGGVWTYPASVLLCLPDGLSGTDPQRTVSLEVQSDLDLSKPDNRNPSSNLLSSGSSWKFHLEYSASDWELHTQRSDAYRISGSGQLCCYELLRWPVELSERTIRYRSCFRNYSELGLPNRLLSLPFRWSSDARRAGLPSNLPQNNFSTRDSPSFCGNELGSGPNCEADCRRARVCSKLEELPSTVGRC